MTAPPATGTQIVFSKKEKRRQPFLSATAKINNFFTQNDKSL